MHYRENVLLKCNVSRFSDMANYEALKASLQRSGEVMIRLDTGEKIELHTHNVKFEDSTKK